LSNIRIAVVGATGMVGGAFLQVLQEYDMGGHDYTMMASARSAGKKVEFMGKEYIIEELTENSFDSGYDIALFSAGGSTSAKFAPIAAEKGCIVVDNSSQWRMDKDVPLVVSEVNPDDIFKNNGIIANPNCSTIQAMVPLKPLYDAFGIKRIVFSTYQSVSGAGVSGWNDLENGIQAYVSGEDYELQKFPYPIFGNCIPHIDVFLDNGYTKEEQKMINETHKILHDDSIAVTATCVRVPVFTGHSESINVELGRSFDLDEVFEVLRAQSGLVVEDDLANNVYPMPIKGVDSDDVFVGRIRRDFSVENGINFWVVSNNIRKGAASNAVQIAKIIIDNMK